MSLKKRIVAGIVLLTILGVAIFAFQSTGNLQYVQNFQTNPETSLATQVSWKENITAEQLSQLPKSEEIPEEDANVSYQGDKIIVSFSEKAFDGKQLNSYAKRVLSKIVSVNESDAQSIDEKTAVLKVRDGASVSQAIQEVSNNSDIAYSQPNYIYTLAGANEKGELDATQTDVATPTGFFDYTATNDPYATQQWMISSWWEPVTRAWSIQKGDSSNVSKPVTVAVLDTGVDSDHEDLKDNLVGAVGVTTTNYGEVEADGEDVYYHGTHCAGIVAATSNNGIGVTGVSHNSKVYSIRIFKYAYWDYENYTLGATSIEIAAGIKEAIDKKDTYNIRVISMSLGVAGSNKSTGVSLDQLVKNQVVNATNNGLSIVAATGNESKTNSLTAVAFPAYLDNVIAVGAVDQNVQRCYFSNGGAEIDVVAPGYKIYSTTPVTKNWFASTDQSVTTNYCSLSGTSMATPYVAATIALMYSLCPTLTTTQVEEILTTTTDNTSRTFSNELGWGKVNPYSALQKVQEVAQAQACKHETTTIIQQVDATCNTVGTTAKQVCSACGEVVSGGEEIPINPDNHANLTEISEKKATCTEDGYAAHQHCNACNKDVGTYATYAKLGHTRAEVVTKEATCSAMGLKNIVCSTCNAVLESGIVIDKLAHTPTTISSTSATCHSTGKTEEVVCGVCSVHISGGEVLAIDPSNHTALVEIPEKSATCKEEGYAAHQHCEACGIDIGEYQKFAIVDHVYVDGVCQWCGLQEQKTPEPDQSQQPEQTEQPDQTQQPEQTEQPDQTQQPEQTEQPDQTQQPEQTEQPDQTQQPEQTEQPDQTQQQVKFVLKINTTESSLVKVDKSEYVAGDSAKITITGKKSGSNLVIPKSIKVDGKTYKTQDQLIDKSSWTSSNDIYKRVMNESANSVEYDKVLASITSGVSIDITNVQETTIVEVEFEELVPVYRLYNSITSEHLFTTNKTEYDSFVEKSKTNEDAWIGEGINWFAPKSGTTVHRLYNAALGAMGRSSHYYTADEAEIANLKTQGWSDDGAENQFMSGGDISIWTCYNEDLGSAHHYTSSETEWRGLAAHGWALEADKNGKTGVFQALMSAVS